MQMVRSARTSLLTQKPWLRLAFNIFSVVILFFSLLYIFSGVDDERVTLSIGDPYSREVLAAVYKKSYENPDGTVDIVLNVPRMPGSLAQIADNKSDTATAVKAPANSVVNATRSPLTNLTSRTHVKTKYPISLDSDFLINPVNLCPERESVHYLVMVHSATAYFLRRQAIRETYGARKLFGHVTQRVVFLLGTTSDVETSRRIRLEALEHGDVVQGPFVDSYHNLTHKGVMGLRWAAEHCSQANVVIKIDDDVYVNTFRFIERVLPDLSKKTNHIACHLRPSGTSPITRGEGKWQVSDLEFKDLKHYPFDYCNGYFVILSGDLIRPMLNAARVNPFFWIDDVYLFGLLPATVGDTKFQDLKPNLTLRFDTGKTCFQNKGIECHLLAVSQWKEKEADSFWYTMLSKLSGERKTDFHLFEKS
ncbi:beta-1,3-galactosyltransferase 5 [Aplysia californica]|uniref:Hexosyltransferase n=1 Tax=Aplysia californica TaxID=6500 RepID=A0ABM0ZWC0_APLCA|nr:beta-1,3-galactosyltransferase 5 [Aplysia californica]